MLAQNFVGRNVRTQHPTIITGLRFSLSFKRQFMLFILHPPKVQIFFIGLAPDHQMVQASNGISFPDLGVRYSDHWLNMIPVYKAKSLFDLLTLLIRIMRLVNTTSKDDQKYG